MTVKTVTGSRQRAKRKDPAQGRSPGVSVLDPSTPADLPEPTSAPSPIKTETKIWLAGCFLLAMASLVVYFPVLSHPFVNYDDVDYVTGNPYVQQGLTANTMRWALTSTAAANWHPLTWFSHALDCQLFGLNPAGHHLASLLFHILNVALVFLLLARVTGKTGRSLAVAALFALHPINVECVAWVAERKSLLAMFFFLLTLGGYGLYARRPNIGRYLAVVGLFMLALAAKPMVVTLPFALLLLDAWPLQRIKHWTKPAEAFLLPQYSLSQLILEKLPLLALSAASSVITLVAQRPAMKTIAAVPFRERIVNAIFSYVMYLGKATWPLHLGVFYAPRGSQLAAWQVLLSAAFLAIASLLVWHGRSHLYLLVGWFWFLGTLVPMIGIVQVGEQGMADRYAYLPLLGIFILVVWGLADVCTNRVQSRIALGAALAIMVVLFVLTRRQLRSWESSFALWSHSLEITKENYVAEDYVGSTLLEQEFKATGQSCADEAMVHFQNAVQINSRDSLGHLNLGYCLQAHRNLGGAIAEYNVSLGCAPNRYLKSRAHLNLGAVYDELGDFTQARDHYNQALRMFPRDQDLLAAMRKLNLDEQVASFAKSAALHPTATAYLQLGQLQWEAGRFSEAQASLEQAVRLDPKSQDGRRALQSLESLKH